ncbi:MAG: membrane protein insertase YidC [Oscillibacter sp.]|nr:membrane protein insertase YidC [Oscillibacter sp.]
MFSTIGYLICIPFAALLRLFYSLTNSYGVSLILFTLVIKLILLPFQMKSKKSMVRMNRMNGKIQEIQKKYANNQMKMNEEIQKFYAEEGINPMSGCLWSFLPMPIMLSLYYILREPIVYFMNFGGRAANLEVFEKAKEVVSALNLSWTTNSNGSDGVYAQIEVLQHISSHSGDPAVKQFLADNPNWVNVDYNFLGIDLTALPQRAFGALKDGVTWAVVGLILIPIISAALSFLLSKVSMAGSQTEGTAAATNKSLMLTMPLMSLWIGFVMPAALGVYWIAQSVFSIIQEAILGRFYMKKIQAEEDARFQAREADRKRRQEEAKTLQEEQKRQTSQKMTLREKQQAAQAAKATKAKKAGTSTTEAGRVGDRPYARGRSYKPDRYDEN